MGKGTPARVFRDPQVSARGKVDLLARCGYSCCGVHRFSFTKSDSNLHWLCDDDSWGHHCSYIGAIRIFFKLVTT